MQPDSSRAIEIRSKWNFFWWVFGTVCLPFTISAFVFNLWRRFKEWNYKNCLPGKVVVITGASSGLGEALAHVFFAAGCKVVLAARRKEELEKVRAELLALHTTVPTFPPVVVPIDLSDLNNIPADVNKILETFSHVDILINNGGISVRADAVATTIDVDIKIMLVNYFGSVAITKTLLPSMIKRNSGHVVFISSIQGKFAIPSRSAYSASKHAVQAFSDSLRAEVEEHNIYVTCVSPGYIRTSLSVNALTGSGEKYGKLDQTTASGTSPELVAKAILKSVLRKDQDVILADLTARIAFWLRIFCPGIYFWIMAQRAKKAKAIST